jgi:hypothetical protein
MFLETLAALSPRIDVPTFSEHRFTGFNHPYIKIFTLNVGPGICVIRSNASVLLLT